mgnify:CR=1 FL=1
MADCFHRGGVEPNDLYQEIIVDHGRHPRNHGFLNEATHASEGFNPLCGDTVNLRVQIQHGIIQAAMFDGWGCALSQASASLMTETIRGKTIPEAELLVRNVRAMMVEGTGAENLGPIQALAPIREYPMRVKCATLAWHTLADALKSPTQHDHARTT